MNNHQRVLKRYLWILPLLAGFILIPIGINSILHAIQRKSENPVNIEHQSPFDNDSLIELPPPALSGSMSVEESLHRRRSVRKYDTTELTLGEISQLLWAAYGISDSVSYGRLKLKTAPSAGATYPLEIYLMAGKVQGIPPGLYRYIPVKHSLALFRAGDIRDQVAEACLAQKMLEDAPASLIYTADFQRTVSRYGERGAERYVCMDIGHSAQNVYLQATALGLATCAVGAFNDETLTLLLDPPAEEKVLYLMPVGRKK